MIMGGSVPPYQKKCSILPAPKNWDPPWGLFRSLFRWGISTQAMGDTYTGPTLPKTNMAPEKWTLGKYFPFGKVYFEGLC